MKTFKYLFYLIMILFFANSFVFAQHGNGGHHFGTRPDSLSIVSVSGIVLTEVIDSTYYHNSTQVHTRYYLDEDKDGRADYHLNFGPYWYEPDSSNAVRPNAGDEITVTGGKLTSGFNVFETIIVYEINGEFWRDPYFANWNNLGRNNYFRRHLNNGCRGGYGFGWNHDSIKTETLSGIAMLDTTFHMTHYYLDTDNDAIPDYILNFGPFWFEPESGAVRPTDGETIKIVGGVFDNSERIPMVMVYELNDLEWRDSTFVGNHFGGGWINGSMTNSREFRAPFDSGDKMIVDIGWRGSGHGGHGGMMQESLYCQILEVFPENIPNGNNEKIFAGYEIHMYNSDGSNAMLTDDRMSGMKMRFNNKIKYQFHYTESQLSYWNMIEKNIGVKFWDEDSQSWTSVNVDVDMENNLINFESEAVGNYVVLTAETSITGLELTNSQIPEEFKLSQNYPNPFNPSTKINFSLSENGYVKLCIYNILGEEIDVIVNSDLTSGTYSVKFDASNLPSGIYIYQMRFNDKVLSKKMNLLK